MGKDNKIKQIRDLVFGEEMEGFDLKFEEIKIDLEESFAQLAVSISESENIAAKENSVAQRSIEKVNKSLEEKNTVLQNKIKSETSKLKEKMLKTIESREQFLLDKIVDMQIKQSENDKVLNQKIKTVEASYVSKNDFSELMLELSLRFGGVVADDEFADKDSFHAGV